MERFARGRLSALDMIRVIGAGLRGGGNEFADGDVGAMQSEEGAAGFAQIVTDLLTATFGSARAEARPPNP